MSFTTYGVGMTGYQLLAKLQELPDASLVRPVFLKDEVFDGRSSPCVADVRTDEHGNIDIIIRDT